jgi:CRISPR/Cas system-associated endonuclease Cas1|tara:strand:+ start:499 stop:909 length:411 start_codon:yes stop_codon:yes gene_type:complete
MSKSKKMSLTKLFSNAATNNLGFVNDAVNFDAGNVIERVIGSIPPKNESAKRAEYRQKQYENYLKTFDRLNVAKKSLPGRVRGGLFTRTDSPTGSIAMVGSNVRKTATTLNQILSKYQDRFLKLAQAKYYQRTTKA